MFRRILIFVMLAGAGTILVRQLTLANRGPEFSVIEKNWRAFWDLTADGHDIKAEVYVYSGNRIGREPDAAEIEALRIRARQMHSCRLDPKPTFESKDEIVYPIHCQIGEESAIRQQTVSRDVDGEWRLKP